jgi:hypothetical protein
MPRKQSDVEAGLKTKGFRSTEGDHHYFIYHTVQNLKTRVKTKTSHGTRELSDILLAQMSRQCHVRRSEFDRLIDCSLSQAGYEEILQSKSQI